MSFNAGKVTPPPPVAWFCVLRLPYDWKKLRGPLWVPLFRTQVARWVESDILVFQYSFCPAGHSPAGLIFLAVPKREWARAGRGGETGYVPKGVALRITYLLTSRRSWASKTRTLGRRNHLFSRWERSGDRSRLFERLFLRQQLERSKLGSGEFGNRRAPYEEAFSGSGNETLFPFPPSLPLVSCCGGICCGLVRFVAGSWISERLVVFLRGRRLSLGFLYLLV